MTFKDWKHYFAGKRGHFLHIDFDSASELSKEGRRLITSSLQQFQRGEYSEGKYLFAFAKKFPDPDYLECIRLFIHEEQMHARVLAKFMDKHGIMLIRSHWVDRVFRGLRKLAGIENTVRVLLVAEIIAKVYYNGLYRATNSNLLKAICQQILEDEEQHIRFQCDALQVLYRRGSFAGKLVRRTWHRVLMMGTIAVVWCGHRRVLLKGNYSLWKFSREAMAVFIEASHRIRRKEPVIESTALWMTEGR